MSAPKNLLCIDADANARLLLVRTLRRIFPQASVAEVQDYQAALNQVGTQSFDVIVARRAIGADPVSLIRGLRAAAAEVPILAVSGSGRGQELLAAGATQFLPSDSWLLVGTTVAGMLDPRCPA